MSDSLPGQIKRGVIWGGANSALMRLGTFIVGIITARLIGPEEFGVFAVALTAYTIVVNLSELGVSAVLMRETESVDDKAPTVVTIALLSSAGLTALLFAAAPAIASALGAPEASAPIRVISIAVMLAGISAVPRALLIRAFRQDLLAATQAASFVTSTVVVIVLALRGGGALALSAAQVTGQAIGTVLIVILAPARYWPGFNRSRARELLKFGLPLAGANLFNFSVYNVDYIVIGRLLGPTQLGYYLLAFNISGWPSSILNAMVNSVAMPAFARIRNDTARLSRFLTATLSAVAGVTVPVSVLLGVLAAPVIVAVYGRRWEDAAPALAALAAFGAIRVASELFSNVIVALGRPRALLVIQIGWLALLIPAMVAAVNAFGIVGAGLAHVAVVGFFVVPGLVYVLHSLTGTRARDLGRSVAVPLAGGVVAGLAAWLVAGAFDGAWPALLAGGATGALVYAAVVGRWLVRIQRAARDLWGSVRDPVTEDAGPVGSDGRPQLAEG